MSVELAVLGAPFLDLTFAGLARSPGPGEEVVARALHVAPGGTGMQAIGAARLGVSTALVAPLGASGLAGLVRAALAAEGVEVAGRPSVGGPGVPVTALLDLPEGVAMASVLAPGEPRPEEVAALEPNAVLASLGRLELVPRGAACYAITGGLELPSVDEDALDGLAGARALVLNAAEAAALTGEDDPEIAARKLAARGAIAVVTMGPDGALAAAGEVVVRADAPEVEEVDATGAGDLFAAAYAWADLRGAPLPDRLAWAALYAALSVRAPTALAGALDLDGLLRAGRERGLRPPRGVAPG